MPLSACRRPELRTGDRNSCRCTRKSALLLLWRTALAARNHLKSNRGDDANKNASFPAPLGPGRRTSANVGEFLSGAALLCASRRTAPDRGGARSEGPRSLSLAGRPTEGLDRRGGTRPRGLQ